MLQYTNHQTSACSQSIIKTLEKGKRRAICSALRIETPGRFTQSTSKIFHTFFSVSFVVDIGQVNVCWENI